MRSMDGMKNKVDGDEDKKVKPGEDEAASGLAVC